MNSSVGQPCIPYMWVICSEPVSEVGISVSSGLILSDLTFIHIGNADYLQDDRIVNFWKRWQQFTILHKLRYCRKWCVFTRPIPILLFFAFLGSTNLCATIVFYIFLTISMITWTKRRNGCNRRKSNHVKKPLLTLDYTSDIFALFYLDSDPDRDAQHLWVMYIVWMFLSASILCTGWCL